ncbi:hypothetical protein [Oceanobacillus halophilus]|nr:hypothetical protein [Oceanobacillus halophilus]
MVYQRLERISTNTRWISTTGADIDEHEVDINELGAVINKNEADIYVD